MGLGVNPGDIMDVVQEDNESRKILRTEIEDRPSGSGEGEDNTGDEQVCLDSESEEEEYEDEELDFDPEEDLD